LLRFVLIRARRRLKSPNFPSRRVVRSALANPSGRRGARPFWASSTPLRRYSERSLASLAKQLDCYGEQQVCGAILA
jgi:hypothetical protein